MTMMTVATRDPRSRDFDPAMQSRKPLAATRSWAVAGLLALVGLGLACTPDPNARKIQYMPDMADSPATKAQRSYLDPPEGAVAMNTLIYPKTVEEAEKLLQMPPRIKEDQATELAGQELYDTFCSVCHGRDAKGEGTLGPAFPRPPDLTHEVYRNRQDGFFFYRITFGSAIMPSYGHAISPHERWQIVSHLRKLQTGQVGP